MNSEDVIEKIKGFLEKQNLAAEDCFLISCRLTEDFKDDALYEVDVDVQGNEVDEFEQTPSEDEIFDLPPPPPKPQPKRKGKPPKLFKPKVKVQE